MKKDNPEKEHRTWLRLIPLVLLIALIAFIAVDGYFNEWKTPKRIWYWNRLELRGPDTLWHLKAQRDFKLIEVKDVRSIVVPESLVVFDQEYRDSSYYRLYFRYSDTTSAQLQKMYKLLKSIDTAGTFQKSIDDAKKVYANFQTILGKPTPSLPDSNVSKTIDSTKLAAQTLLDTSVVMAQDSVKLHYQNVSMQTNDEAMVAIKKIVGSPPVLIGLSIGAAISVGIDLLQGKAYCAVARQDVFRVDSVQIGIQAGTWEGMPIDILWALGPKKITDSVQTNITADSTLQAVDSLKANK